MTPDRQYKLILIYGEGAPVTDDELADELLRLHDLMRSAEFKVATNASMNPPDRHCSICNTSYSSKDRHTCQ